MFTFGAVVEEYILVRAADDVAIALLPGVVISPVALAALSVEVALAPGATAEVDVETAVAGCECIGSCVAVSVTFSAPLVWPIVKFEYPGDCPWCTGTFPRMSGSLKLVTPSPPYVTPSKE